MTAHTITIMSGRMRDPSAVRARLARRFPYSSLLLFSVRCARLQQWQAAVPTLAAREAELLRRTEATRESRRYWRSLAVDTGAFRPMLSR